MVSRCRLNLVTYIISFMFCQCAAVGPFCSAALFGVPSWSECNIAFSVIPYAGTYRNNPKAAKFRLYSEPQYLVPQFGFVYNRYAPSPINQLPKIWQSSRL